MAEIKITFDLTFNRRFVKAVSVVAIGKFEGDHFEAQQLLVKCPSKYQAEADKAAAKGVPS